MTIEQNICKRAILIARFIADRSGTTAIEYGVIAALLSIAVLAGSQLIGEQTLILFQTVAQELTSIGAD
ncbi:MAG TPA: Flp family type IVb pilin [Microvirga sp.]|nr:Flp family type IVb pilin [Microvirga sp.]